MEKQSNLATPNKSRDHARAQAGTVVLAMPTIPATHARDLPPGVLAADVVWDETLDAGDYATRVLKRGTRLRLTNPDGDGCANLLVFNADRPIERLNVADTVKVQWNAYLGKGSLLLSDMGRVLMSFVADTSGQHDAFCGCSDIKSNAAKYGQGHNYSPFPSARDRFLLALLKHGLGKKDIPANINLFKHVRVEKTGGLTFIPGPAHAGQYVELRAEMNVLVALANTPHVLDPRPTYTASPIRITAYRGPPTPPDDEIRTATPESLRAFQNTEDFFVC